MPKEIEPSGNGLHERIAAIVERARSHVARSVNSAMVHAYWLIGREIVESEQAGLERAAYGERLVDEVAERLTARYGKGFGATNVKRMRKFYLSFPNGSAVPAELGGPGKGAALRHQFEPPEPIPEPPAEIGAAVRHLSPPVSGLFPPQLSWTHYRLLLTVNDSTSRSFYEIEAAKERWSTRELERQIASLLFERLAKSRDQERVLQLGKQGQEVSRPEDVVKDPMVLEFLALKEQPHWLERDLEQAIIDRLEDFLLELGKGFCFVARQKRLTLGDDHFYVDLVFYNRLLRAFVLLDLKLGKLTHQDLGQMQMYVRCFDEFHRTEGEGRTIGIVLCSSKNDAVVRFTLPEDNQQVVAARYQLYLPTEDELKAEVEHERAQAERHLRLESSEDSNGRSKRTD